MQTEDDILNILTEAVTIEGEALEQLSPMSSDTGEDPGGHWLPDQGGEREKSSAVLRPSQLQLLTVSQLGLGAQGKPRGNNGAADSVMGKQRRSL